MASPSRHQIASHFVVLPFDDIDTDQIIPARFLTGIVRAGLGRALFADWRHEASWQSAGFPLDRPEAQGVEILVAGRNFGCGSSREHAPWALLDAGIRAVICRSVADIFRANALKNGLLPVVVSADMHAQLVEGPAGELIIDLETCTLTATDGATEQFEIDRFARHLILNDLDELDFLLRQRAAVERYEQELPCTRS